MVTALLLAATAALSGSYDCLIDRQVVINENGVQPGAVVNLDGGEGEAWRFNVRLIEHRNAATQVEVRWPANPIQIAGTQASLDLGPGHLAFLAMSPPPCMFTEANCMALVQLSARADGSAAFTIMPTGLAGDESSGRTQLHVIFTGACRRQGGS